MAVGWSICFWTAVHVTAHYFNYLHLSFIGVENLDASVFFNYLKELIPAGSPESFSLRTGPAVTGLVALLALFMIATSAVTKVRQVKFEIFYITHHLMLLFFLALLPHGWFCFIRPDADSGAPKCYFKPQFWIWTGVPISIYLFERLFKVLQSRLAPARILKVVQHPSKVVEVQFQKRGFSAIPGQYIQICCPEVSPIQWHPFTLTSYPGEDYFSIHINVLGDWTSKFAKRVGCRFDKDDHGFLLVNL